MNTKNKDGLTEKEFIENYKPKDYARPSVTVDMLLFTVVNKEIEDVRKLPDKDLKILLIKRKDHPYINHWAIPGGFVDINESIENAVYRELEEETNISNVYMEQLFTYGDVNRDPRMRVISVSHMALVPSNNLKPKAGDDAKDVAWFSINKNLVSKNTNETIYDLILENKEKNTQIIYTIKEESFMNGVSKKVDNNYTLSSESHYGLAFDHFKIIDTALDRLKNKVEYTSIAFNLLPKKFTLTELQKVYEVILNKPLQKTAFRRKISPMVIETSEISNDVGHRPAKYYKFNSEWNHEF